MSTKETTKISKNAIPFLSLPFAVATVFMGLFINLFPGSSRQYHPVDANLKNIYKGVNTKAMMQYFLNARKNIATNSMDYQSMLAADMADRAMKSAHHTNTSSTLPAFTWNSVGPTNIGGRTRALLIDNNDATHQTIFAGGVSGGIWKSTNGGAIWGTGSDASLSYSVNDNLSNMNVSCIAQDANGALYIGTGEGFSLAGAGEGFSTGLIGGGIFKSTDDGSTWNLLPSTVPTANKDSVSWAFVNRIAVRPDNANVIYAATNAGFYVSHNAGVSWRYVKISGTDSALAVNSLDVKISGDGSIIVACIGGFGYYCYPQSGSDSTFTEMNASSAHGRFNDDTIAASRIEFAISPTNPNRIFASFVDYTGDFGTGARYSRILMTTTAKTNGGYWYDIGPGGSVGFNPYENATFNNALAVNPANEAQALCGGSTIWEWSGASLTDSVGQWTPVTHEIEEFGGDPLWIQTGQNTIIYDQNTPTNVYVACSGGIFKSTNVYINPSSAEASIANIVFGSINRNYDVTQYYTVCYSSQVNYKYNGVTNTVGLGIGGGSQDNGSPYISGLTTGYPYDAVDFSGGDGGGSAISQLNPNIAYFSTDDGTLLRTEDLGDQSFPTIAYNETSGYDIGGDIDSVWELGTSCPVFPIALYENAYDTLNLDSLQFIATTTYSTGQIIWPTSQNGPTTYPYVLPHALAVGDTLTVPDRVVSRVAIGFDPKNGIWINGQGANSTGTVVWMPIAGPLSKPDAFSDTGKATNVHCLTWSADGDALFVGTEDGVLYRFANINSIIADKYRSGALWSKIPGVGIRDTTNQVVSTNLTLPTLVGRDILSIACDPQNGNNLLFTLGNYGTTNYIYYCNNALSATPTFTNVQGNLPYMPIYSSILDIRNPDGTWNTNSVMIGTEHGVYTTTDITASPVVWTPNNSGMANNMVLAIKQQIAEPWACNNAGDIYLASHGRGLWVSNTNYNVTTSVPKITAATPLNSLLVYPSPMTNQGNIEFNLASADNVLISIYDMQGKEIKTVNMGTQSPGNHVVSFEATSFPAGVYFASLTGTNFKKISKFIVVK